MTDSTPTIRPATMPDDIARAAAIDATVIGAHDRAAYIADVAGRGGLTLGQTANGTLSFCCLDRRHFFGKPFVSLLVVHPAARRQGLGRAHLAQATGGGHGELWTSTNRSNAAMRALLAKTGWQFCGELVGLDPGDPELFFTSPKLPGRRTIPARFI
jgi:GNAT superfamily N-acetyltransferase